MESTESVNKPIDIARRSIRPEDIAKRKRSGVTNGKRAFLFGDGNSPWYRRFKDIVELHASDLGGADYLSEAQLILCRRASTMEVELERMEGQLSLGHDVDLEAYSRIAQRLHAILAGLGLQRVARPVDRPLEAVRRPGMIHRIDLRPDLRKHNWGDTPMLYNGKLIDASDQPEYAAARWLLNNGAAFPEDRLETYRGDMLCMSGIIGKLAKWAIRENAHGNPTLQLVHYKAFSSDTVRPLAAKTGFPVQWTRKPINIGIAEAMCSPLEALPELMRPYVALLEYELVRYKKKLSAADLRKNLHYEPDTGVFTRLVSTSPRSRAAAAAGFLTRYGYRRMRVNKDEYYAHRFAWLYMTGEWPTPQVDHINRVRNDDRWVNLREVTASAQNTNKTIEATWLRGVSWRKALRKWWAQIQVNGKKYHLGFFPTPGQAHNAYCEAAKKYFGELACVDGASGVYLGSFDCPAAAELASILNVYKTYGKPVEVRSV